MANTQVAVVLNTTTDNYEYWVPKIFVANEDYTAEELAQFWIDWQKDYTKSDLYIQLHELDDNKYEDPKFYNYNIYTDVDDYIVRETTPFETDDKRATNFYFNLTWNDFVEDFTLEDLVHLSLSDPDISSVIDTKLLEDACKGIYTVIRAYSEDYIASNGGIEVFEDSTKQSELTNGIRQETIKYLTETFPEETGEESPIDIVGASTKVNYFITNFN